MTTGMHQLAERLRHQDFEPSLAPALLAARAQAGRALASRLDWPSAKAEGLVGSALDHVHSHPWQHQATLGPSREALAEASACLQAMPDSQARLVFVDGLPAPTLDAGVHDGDIRLQPFGGPHPAVGRSDFPAHLGALGLHTDEAYAALNTALLSHGVQVVVEPNTVAQAPLAVVFVSTSFADDTLVQPRVLVSAGAHSEITLYERHVAVGTGQSWSNGVTEVIADEGAQVHLVVEQDSNAASFHMGTIGMRVGRNAHCRLTTVDVGAKLCRRSVRTELLAPGATSSMWHVAMARDGAHASTRALTRHAAADTTSHQRFRAVAGEQGQASFCGTVHIVPDASRANAEQMSRGLLLAQSGKVSLRPQLKIAHDDVKCAHGATVGALDAEALFYLTSRGIAEREARELLTFAFLADALGGVNDSLRTHFERLVARWLGGDARSLASHAVMESS